MTNHLDTAKAAGFTIVQTGGSCTAWRKDYADHYVLITNSDGTDHELADNSDSYLVGAYELSTGDELGMLVGDASPLATIERALEAAEGLATVALEWDTKLAIRLAKLFSEKVQIDLTARQVREMIYRNKCEPEGSNVCHSHDFCDANMPMAEAFKEATGREPMLNVDSHNKLWTAAWDIAKAADFFI